MDTPSPNIDAPLSNMDALSSTWNTNVPTQPLLNMDTPSLNVNAPLSNMDALSSNKDVPSLNMDAPAASGSYYYHFPTEPTYAPLPFTDMTVPANLFSQALHAPPSLELPPLYNTAPSMDSGLGLVAMAEYSNSSIHTNDFTLTGSIDYHSSDHIFNRFNAKFGSLDSTK